MLNNKFKMLTLFIFLSVSSFGDMTIDTLRYVIDGDTAVFKTMKCRFAYIDTPESGNNAKARKDSAKFNIALPRIYKAGRYAKRYTKSKLHKGKKYPIDVIGTDRYGRKICAIYIGTNVTINDMLIQDGFAVPFWRYIPKRLKQKYIRLTYDAERNSKGLWRIDPVLMRKMK